MLRKVREAVASEQRSIEGAIFDVVDGITKNHQKVLCPTKNGPNHTRKLFTLSTMVRSTYQYVRIVKGTSRRDAMVKGNFVFG